MKTRFIILILWGISIYSYGQQRYNPNVKHWAARHNLSAIDYQNEVTKYHKKGFRLIHVDGYTVKGKTKFAAIWTKGTTKGLKAKHGLNTAAYQKAVELNHKNGFRLLHVDIYKEKGKLKYAAIWQKKDTKGLRAKHGLNHSQYQKEAVKNHKDGYKLTHISGCGLNGKAYYAAIWNKGSSSRQITRHGLTASQYQDNINKHWKNGYRVTHVDSYNVSGTIRYAVIFEKVKGRYSARHGLSSKNYQLQVDNHYYQGFVPICVSGYGKNSKSGFTVVFKNVTPWKSADVKQFDTRIKSVMKKFNIPGASVAIVKDGKLVYAKGYGYGSRENKEIAAATSLYRIASVSKPLTGVAIMKLTETTNLDLEQRVFGPGRILGSTYGKNTYSSREKQIKVRHLLEHRAGGNSWDNNTTPNPSGGGADNWGAPMFQKRDLSQKSLISWVLDNRNPSDNVNSVTAYSNFAYCVLGRIIEKKSGLSYEKYVQSKILKPCGIKNMHIGSSKKDSRRYKEVVYYGNKDNNPYWLQMKRMDSHGGWIASVVDLMRFAVRVDGDNTKKDILKNGSIKTMQTSSYGGRYGKGWDLNNSLMQHGGRMTGTRAHLKLMNNGTYYVYAINKYDGSNDPNNDMTKAIEDGIDAIKNWPAIDLF